MHLGFLGVDNPLFFKENCRVIFGDAKESLNAININFLIRLLIIVHRHEIL